MPKTLRIKVEDIIPEFVQLSKKGKNNLLISQTIGAVERLSQMYMALWSKAAGGMHLDGLPFNIYGTNYPASIKRRQINPTVWEVYSDYTTKTGLGVTDLLEKGHGNIDLKPGLLNGPKSRSGKNGRYNIVSFRHGRSGSDPYRNNPMPLSIDESFTTQVKQMDEAKKAGASDISGTSYVSKSSAVPGGRSYDWGAQFDKTSKVGAKKKTIMKKGKRMGDYAWKSGKYAGMYRLQQTTSAARDGKYMTFRVVSSRSDPMSWIVPEQEPWPIRDSVVNHMRPIAEGMLKEAMEADFK